MFFEERDSLSPITDDERLTGIILRRFRDVLGPDEFARIAGPCVVSNLDLSDDGVRARAKRALDCEDAEFLEWVDARTEEDVSSVFEDNPVKTLANLVAEEFENDLLILEAVGRADIIRDVVLAVASVMRDGDTLARRISSEAADDYADWLERRAGDGTVEEILWGIIEDGEED